MAGRQGFRPTPFPHGHKEKERITADAVVSSSVVESGDSYGATVEAPVSPVTSEGMGETGTLQTTATPEQVTEVPPASPEPAEAGAETPDVG